ncbi:MAG TPA: sugar ABC transporter substrate-binding protein [Rhodospirillales bacterium]|nr:sugar ABC transporter substrate-binding protein [Rhodospirillales bacterium]
MNINKKLLFALTVSMLMAVLMSSPTYAQKKITFLSWNISANEGNFRQIFAEFEQANPGFEIEWLDKKGTEWATFYQTQVVAGTQPDVIDVQGLLWAEYAANDHLLDLTPYLASEPKVHNRFTAGALDIWALDGRNFMLPFYFTKSILLYNKNLFREAGLRGPPVSFDEILSHAAKIHASGPNRSGLISLNFDWLYWSLFELNGVDLLSPDMKKAAFNTPAMLQTLTKLANATKAGHIDKISWTGRWVEPNSAFAAGNIGMHQASTSAVFWTAGKADWMNPDTAGVAPMPDNIGVPNAHGFGIAKKTKYPKEAWEFVKLLTSKKWQGVFADKFTILTLHKGVDKALIARISKSDPLKASALRISQSNLDKLTATWQTPIDSQIKDAFWPPIQAALLGEKEPATAISDAERAVNRVLRRLR